MSPLINFRLDDEAKERWTAEAKKRGLSLAAFVRIAVEREVEGEERSIVLPPSPGPPPRKGRARTGMCEHRIPADRHCKTCDP